MSNELVIPWGSPPCVWPPYQNGAPEPYLSSDLGVQVKLQQEFTNAWWASQDPRVQKFRGMKPFQIVDQVENLIFKKDPTTGQVVPTGFVLDGALIGIIKDANNNLMPTSEEQDPFLTIGIRVYEGYGSWYPGLGTPLQLTPGHPECAYGIPGDTPPGKLPFEQMPVPVGALLNCQAQLETLLMSIGVTSIHP